MKVERILLSPPDVGAAEERSVLAALRSGWVAPVGPEVDAFERDLADRTGRSHVVALSSGTAALHLGLLTLGVGPGDVVPASTMTFAATANAINYTGAEPFFVDVDPATGNLCPELLERALHQLTSAGERVGAVVPVDLLGKVVDHTAIGAVAARFGVPVLADAAESMGAQHAGRSAAAFGRAAVVSFNGNKVMTTSGGGALLTDDVDLARRVRYLATQARQPVAHYEHVDIGYNYRLSNLLAALGRTQLARLDEMIARRRSLRARYKALVADVAGVEVLGADGDEHDNAWLTAVVVDPSVTGWCASDLGAALAAANIESRPLWKPMHLQPVFAQARGVITGVSERLFRSGLALPSGSALGEDQVKRVLDVFSTFVTSRP